jgi:putative SOS response-associated peptidase YedK
MCGRFTLNVTPNKIKEYFDLTGELNFSPSWNIAPATLINSIIADEDENRCLKLMYWGLIPGWAKDKTIGNRLINARGETV